MKSYAELKAEMESIQQQTVEAKQAELANDFFLLNAYYVPDQVEEASVFCSDCDTNLHESNPLYQENNWFPDKYIELLQSTNIKKCFEIGSGNGKATQNISKFVQSLISVDLIPNPFAYLEDVRCYTGFFSSAG